MAPYHNLPELLKPLHPPHLPDHHKHDAHDHPHPSPSLRVTSIGMALLSLYILLLVAMALFTLWRVSRKRHSMPMPMPGSGQERTALLSGLSREDDLAFRRFGFGGGAGGSSKMKGIARSREPEQRRASGSGIPNTHLSHEDIGDTEETTLLPQSPQMEDEGNTEGISPAEGGRSRTEDGSGKWAERESTVHVPDGLRRAAESGRGIFA